ncbi:MAG: DNA internalization-related competence protein ComEC/Rec2 [Peptoniphilaceae bacterium]|nr:DNA internalization-related competence protein ComEC/Rec2 [Peptoniphilaceae bacterium]
MSREVGMRRNLFFILLGILSGIGIFIGDRSLGFYVLLVSLFLTLVFFLYKSPLIFLSLGVLFGFFYASFNFSSYRLIDKDTRILETTILEKKETEGYFTYITLCEDVEDGVKERSVFTSDEDYDIGDKLLIKAKVDLPARNTNPYLFSYRSYLLSKKVKSTIEIEKLYGRGRSSSLLLSLKKSFYKYIHRIFDRNLEKESADFVSSVILGENLIRSDEIKDLGLSHILAVSGLHIDILVTFILFIFSYFNLNYRYGYLTALGLCFFYGYLISFPFSVMRVLIMTSIGYLSYILKKPEDKKKSLLLASLFILLINPFAILSAGYILTFAAGIGIYIIYPNLKYLERDSFIIKQAIFALSIQLSIFPFLVYYYGKINLISIFANLIVVPIFELSMYFIFGLILLYPLMGTLLGPIFKILDILIRQVLGASRFLAYFKFFTIEFKKESILLSIFLLGLILVLLSGRKKNILVSKLYLGLSIIIVGFLTFEPMIFDQPAFYMVDIGQGDAFILKDGRDVYLFDLGGPSFKPYNSGEKILLPLLKSMGIKDIKAVFISHMDKDHAGNLEVIEENFKIKNVISTALNEDELSSYNFTPMAKGDRVKLKNGYIEAVFDGVDGDNKNNKSLGLLINIKGNKILRLGDLESAYEDQLKVKADILKLSHHGSRTSTSKTFIEDVNPQVTLISAGRNNTYGHPHKEVLENIKASKVYNTQEDGFVEIKFLEDSYRVEPYLKGDFFQ